MSDAPDGPDEGHSPGAVNYSGYTRAAAFRSCGVGWTPLTARAWDAATKRGAVVIQVKEKMGRLVIYTRAPDRATWAVVRREMDAIADESARICEACGRPGVLRDEAYRMALAESLGRAVRRWYKTLCDRCAWAYYAEDATAWGMASGVWHPDDEDRGDEGVGT